MSTPLMNNQCFFNRNSKHERPVAVSPRQASFSIVKTNDFMQEIGKTLGYDYVMSYRVGGAMLYANESHDITTEIIKLLNQRYETSK